MRTLFFILLAICSGTLSMAQYAPQAGVPGSTAISATSSLFTGWATECVLAKGYMNIDSPLLGTVSIGDNTNAIGAVDHYIVSMGDSGVATVSFASALYDGPGDDFAVFENGFKNAANDSQAFLELAFVEVSSDGSRYVRFPAMSLTPTSTQIPGSGVYMYANLVHNLAGKYIRDYGTPFDLHELADSPGLDISNVTHVRLIDVIGSTSVHATRDAAGNIINDPYTTQFPTGGFDLDAVGAIHQKPVTNSGMALQNGSIKVNAYPNPVTEKLFVSVNGAMVDGLSATLTTVAGRELQHYSLVQHTNEIAVDELPAGMYYLILRDANGNKWVEKVSKL